MAKLQKDTVSDGVSSFAEMNQSPGNKQSRFDAASCVVLDLPNVKAPSHFFFFSIINGSVLWSMHGRILTRGISILQALAQKYRERFNSGSPKLDKFCFTNNSYYTQAWATSARDFSTSGSRIPALG